MEIGNTQIEQSCLLGFLSTSAINRYSFLCLEVKMGRLLCHQPAREQFFPHQSASQSVPETMAACWGHRELYNAGPHFLAYKATLGFSCQDRLLPAVASALGSITLLFTLLPCGFGAFLLPVSYGLLGLHTHLWILRPYTAPDWCVMRLFRVQHLSCAKLHAAWKCEGYHEVINLSQD